MVGLTIAAFSIFDLFGFRVVIAEKFRVVSGMGFGLAAGIFGALTALNGWAFIIYLMGIGVSRPEFRSTIALLFLVSGFLISSSFWVLGWLSQKEILLGLFALSAAFPGMSIGNHLGSKLPGELFRKLVLAMLVLIGGVLMAQGLDL